MIFRNRLLFCTALALASATAFAATPGAPVEKNWTAPAWRTQAQALVESTMKANADLLSMTLHGSPPGAAARTYTMFAGSFPDRIGKVSSEDDVMVIESGFTIIDPRWNKTDPERKFLVLLPLRDVKGRNVGCIVFAFKDPAGSGHGEAHYLARANALRDGLKAGIADHAALFAEAL